MNTLTISDVRDDIVHDLEEQAKLHRRTLAEEARLRLARPVGKSPEEVKRVLERFRKSREALSVPPLTEEFLEKAKNWGRP